jgi:methylthioribose-1-phosphate isomerase
MRIGAEHYRTLWLNADERSLDVIDQTELPHALVIRTLATTEEVAGAIEVMMVRGAPLIGATAAYGIALAMAEDPSDANLDAAATRLSATRPTAVNLFWALHRMKRALVGEKPLERRKLAYALAEQIAMESVAQSEAIGVAGQEVISRRWQALGRARSVNILTHCNAGWLAAIDWGTALAPVYKAHEAGIAVRVYVDETRPRNQGVSLTAFELGAHGVPHTLIVDNAGGHLMQQGEIDLCIVGADRVGADGAVCNKIGTYLKALAAYDNGVPFYVAMPSSSIDWNVKGEEIPIEERSAREVTHIRGLSAEHGQIELALAPEGTAARNPAFDVTPARLVSGYLTERGLAPDVESLRRHFPEG